MKTVRINRNRWDRGAGIGAGVLWNCDTKCGCVLGHAIKQISRIPSDLLNHKDCPNEVFKTASTFTKISIDPWDMIPEVVDNELSTRAMDINDNDMLSDKQREYKLKQLFSKNGIKLEFFN